MGNVYSFSVREPDKPMVEALKKRSSDFSLAIVTAIKRNEEDLKHSLPIMSIENVRTIAYLVSSEEWNEYVEYIAKSVRLIDEVNRKRK